MTVDLDKLEAEAKEGSACMEALDPPTVLELVAALRAAEAKIAEALEVHRPIECEPSGTICEGCSTRLPHERFLPYVEYPCPTVRALTGGEA